MNIPGPIGRTPTATTFEDCLRRCEPCGIGASNGSGSPTHIHLDPLGNIPCEAREGARDVLGGSMNLRNRASKWLRFGYSTSEDAVTWVVFTYLLRSGKLATAVQTMGLSPGRAADERLTMLLWGSPVDAPHGGMELRKQLESVCASLGEGRTSFSEPDVVLDLGDAGVVFIEVKHRSGNDIKDHAYSGWQRYAASLRKNADFERVRDSGCYELARNWCLVKAVAGPRPATLVNLGPSSLFRQGEGNRLGRFAAALDTDERSRFQTLTWSDFLRPIMSDAPGWFSDFCYGRGLLPTSMVPFGRIGPSSTGLETSKDKAATSPPVVAKDGFDLLSIKERLRTESKAGRATLPLMPESLARAYELFTPLAPRRSRPYLSATRNGVTSSGGFSNREEEHLAVALFNAGTLELPDGGTIRLADYQTPLKAVRADAGIGKVDLLGIADDGTIVVIELKAGRSREDRRIGLIEALIYAASIEANLDAIARELEDRLGRDVRRRRPDILILASSQYWRSSEPEILRELNALASDLGNLMKTSVALLSLAAQLGSYGLDGAKPQFVGLVRCDRLPSESKVEAGSECGDSSLAREGRTTTRAFRPQPGIWF